MDNPALTLHGLSLPDHPLNYLYTLWHAINQRCYDVNRANYKWYGARGISVYPEWQHDAVKFATWVLANIGERPEGKSLDRLNGDGNYEPGNLRWATKSEQEANKSHEYISWLASRNVYRIKLPGTRMYQCKTMEEAIALRDSLIVCKEN